MEPSDLIDKVQELIAASTSGQKWAQAVTGISILSKHYNKTITKKRSLIKTQVNNLGGSISDSPLVIILHTVLDDSFC